jgi:hypothetical protein
MDIIFAMFMKLRLTYLFLLGLFFCKAFSYSASQTQVNNPDYSFAQSFYNNSAVCFTASHNEGALLQPSLFIEDTEDDDYSSEKKKQPGKRHYIIYNNTRAVVSPLYSFQHFPPTGRCPLYSFPSRYIFIRSIKV